MPYNASYPTFCFGLTLTVDTSVPVDPIVLGLQFLVDVTNYRGGISYRGQPHYVSITYANDDGSTALARLVYEDMMASGNYSVLLAPFSDAMLQAVSPLLSEYPVTMLSLDQQDPEDYGAQPGLFGMVDTADHEWRSSLTAVNAAAQRYHDDTGLGSPNGISTFCLYTANETLLHASAEGARIWIAEENARRGNADNISVLVDMTWSNAATRSYLDYIPPLLLCPDDTDVMLMMADSDSGLTVVSSLRASLRRPKAALGLNPVTQFAYGNPAQAIVTAGWVVPLPLTFGTCTLGPQGGIFYSITDAYIAKLLWQNGTGSTEPDNLYEYLYWSAFGIVGAAVTRADSLDPAGLRAALLSLNGQQSLLTELEFDNTTGVNVAIGSQVGQTNSTGGATAIVYPYDWPWRKVAYGDALSSSLDQTPVLIAVIIAVLGAWVASIIVEQSVFVRRRGGPWPLWLLVVASSLGGASLWCSMLMMTTGLSLVLPDGESQSISWSVSSAFLSLLPCLVLTYLGLAVLIGDVELPVKQRGQTRAVQAQQMLEEKEAKKKRAAVSAYNHVIHLLQSVSWRVAVGGLIVAAALPWTRLTLQSVWAVSGTYEVAGWSWAVTLLLDALLVPLSMLLCFHALRWRVAGVFVFAAAVLQDWLVQYAAMNWTYAPYGDGVPAALQRGLVSQEGMQLLAGIIAAAVCLSFIGLQFSRMHLSRNGLTVLVATLEERGQRQRAQLDSAAQVNDQLRQQLDAVTRMLDFITLNTPLPTEYAFLLAWSSTYATFQAACANAANASNHINVARGTYARRATAELLKPRLSSTAETSTSEPARGAPRLHSNSASIAPAPNSPEPPAVPLAALKTSDASPQRELSTSGGGRTRGPTELAEEEEAGKADAVFARPGKSALFMTEQNLVMHTGLSRSSSASEATSPTNAFALTLIPPPAAASGSISSSRKRPIIPRQWKAYEDELLASLEAQRQWKDEQQQLSPVSPAAVLSARLQRLASRGGSVSSDDSNCTFDYALPLLGRLSSPPEAALLPQGAVPSLLSLLSHPVCVELLKAELQAIHSVENVVFYLHVQRFRQMTRPATRKAIAGCIYRQFIRQGAPQEINVNSRQREAIGAAVSKKADDDCHAELFREAEREVLLLMETNVLRVMHNTARQRLCAWVLATMPLKAVTEPASDDSEDTHSIAPEFASSRNSLDSRASADLTPYKATTQA